MEDIFAALDKILADTRISKEALTTASKIKAKATKVITDANARLEYLKSPDSANVAFKLAETNMLATAPNIVAGEIMIAIKTNTEFSFPAFYVPLLDVANDPDLYSITYRGNGWNKKAIVSLAMDKVAGTISDYAQAVSDTREYLRIGEGDAVKASDVWKKYYKANGRIYTNTISTRLQFTNSKAPWWSLLNYGNKVNMSSDRGGYAYPNMSGTRFVDNAETKLRESIQVSMNIAREQNKVDISRVETPLSDLKAIMERLSSRLDTIARNFDAAEITSNQIIEICSQADKLITSIRRYIKTSVKSMSAVSARSGAIASTISTIFGE
jgi:hypothetical protein